MSMSDKKLDSLNFLLTTPPLLKTTVTKKVEKFCNVSVNTHAIDGMKLR